MFGDESDVTVKHCFAKLDSALQEKPYKRNRRLAESDQS